MKFVDEATITVRSGDGGPGCVSFRREKFIPKGGPDGGDGGKGGDVLLTVSRRKRTLYDFSRKHHFTAENGLAGAGREKNGRNGKDLVIEMPPGVQILDAENGQFLKDLTEPGDTFVIARGGRGGRGNTRFKSSTNRTPRFAQPGEPGETLTLKLELKLIADVGIIGLPNAGKSTLISVISAARPKIANYPFTTLTPTLGVVKTPGGGSFIAADIPGLIEGASDGAGLGIRFLKHIERTRILVHLIDASTIDPSDPLSAWKTINDELGKFSPDLAKKPQIVVLNKIDLPNAMEKKENFLTQIPVKRVLEISAVTQKGVRELLNDIVQKLEIAK